MDASYVCNDAVMARHIGCRRIASESSAFGNCDTILGIDETFDNHGVLEMDISRHPQETKRGPA